MVALRGLLMAVALLAVVGAVSGCGSSGPVSTPADVTVCKQFNVYNSSGPNAANPLGAFESQWAADASPSSQLASDVANYLSLMASGGWAPGSGEQNPTAQAAVNIENYCASINVS
jgi:predicted small lipoprotein YifL